MALLGLASKTSFALLANKIYDMEFGYFFFYLVQLFKTNFKNVLSFLTF